jgi:CelD/BcsL family acetyltransferase involved in cellulose biosynthesis
MSESHLTEISVSESAAATTKVLPVVSNLEPRSEPSGIREIAILDTWTSLQPVSHWWEEWQQNPNADMDFVRFILQIRPECKHPYVVSIRNAGDQKALLIGRLERPRVSIKVGYLRVARPELRVISFLYGGLLGALDQQDSDELVRTILHRLSLGDADAVHFSHVRQDSPLAKSLQAVPGKFRRDISPTVQLHRSLRIPENVDAFYAGLSSKVRKNQKWQAKKLMESFEQQVEVRSYTLPDHLDTIFRQVDQVASTTYQRGLGVGFSDTPEMRGRFDLAARRGWLQAFILYLGGKPAAFWVGTRYRNRFFSDFMGYDATHAKYSPGMYLVLKGIEHFCLQTGPERITEIDFGLGDAQYKQVLATDSWTEQSCYLYALNLRGVTLNLSLTVSGLIDKSARAVLRKLNLEDYVKSGWRKRVAQRP